jgi:hypothetical protein
VGTKTRRAVAAQLLAWEAGGHVLDQATTQVVTDAAHGVDVARAQASTGSLSGRSLTLAAANLLDVLDRVGPVDPTADLDRVFADLLADPTGDVNA